MISHNIGILKQDSAIINNYFSGVPRVSLKTYDNINQIIEAFNNKSISNMIVPNYISIYQK